MAKMVRAPVMTGPGKIEIQEFPYPRVPDDAALLKPLMCGICGSDKHMYKGDIERAGAWGRGPDGARAPFPFIPGHEIVGEIAEIGNKAARTMEIGGKTLKVGDMVTVNADILCGHCWGCRNIYGYSYQCENLRTYGYISCKEPPHLFGGYGEYMYLLPGPQTVLFKVPEGMPPEIAVLTEPMAVAYAAITKASEPFPIVKEGYAIGDFVVVQGSGPIGLLHAAMAKIAGAGEIVVIGAPEYRLRMAREVLGVRTMNIIETPDSKERVRQILESTDGRGADLVIECAGVANAVPEGIDMTRNGGTFLEVGNFMDTGTTSIHPQRQLCNNNIRIIGIAGYPYQAYAPVLKILQRARVAKTIAFEKFVTHKFKLDQAEQAIRATMGEECLKVVIAS